MSKASPILKSERSVATKALLAEISNEVAVLETRLADRRILKKMLEAFLKEGTVKEHPEPEATTRSKVRKAVAPPLKKKPVVRREPQKPFDHRAVCETIARELAPEFDSHQFRKVCLSRYPDRADEFTMLKVKKRLTRMSGFENSLITQIAKGIGRRPPRYRVNQSA